MAWHSLLPIWQKKTRFSSSGIGFSAKYVAWKSAGSIRRAFSSSDTGKEGGENGKEGAKQGGAGSWGLKKILLSLSLHTRMSIFVCTCIHTYIRYEKLAPSADRHQGCLAIDTWLLRKKAKRRASLRALFIFYLSVNSIPSPPPRVGTFPLLPTSALPSSLTSPAPTRLLLAQSPPATHALRGYCGYHPVLHPPPRRMPAAVGTTVGPRPASLGCRAIPCTAPPQPALVGLGRGRLGTRDVERPGDGPRRGLLPRAHIDEPDPVPVRGQDGAECRERQGRG